MVKSVPKHEAPTRKQPARKATTAESALNLRRRLMNSDRSTRAKAVPTKLSKYQKLVVEACTDLGTGSTSADVLKQVRKLSDDLASNWRSSANAALKSCVACGLLTAKGNKFFPPKGAVAKKLAPKLKAKKAAAAAATRKHSPKVVPAAKKPAKKVAVKKGAAVAKKTTPASAAAAKKAKKAEPEKKKKAKKAVAAAAAAAKPAPKKRAAPKKSKEEEKAEPEKKKLRKAAKAKKAEAEVEGEGAGAAAADGSHWEFVENDKSWQPFSSAASALVEAEYQKYLADPTMLDVRSVKSGNWTYQVDFVNMKQTNIEHPAHTVRDIRRVTA